MTNDDGHLMRTILDALATRQRVVNIFVFTLRGAMTGICAAALLTMILAISGFPPALGFIAVCIAAGAGAGTLLGVLRRRDTLKLARALDRAAGAEDRLASAVDLEGKAPAASWRLVRADAVSRVSGTHASQAIPFHTPSSLRWLPVPIVILIATLWLAPGSTVIADTPVPDVSPEQWTQFEQFLRDEIEKLPEPKSEDTKQVAAGMERLARLLERQPEKKLALAQLAKLRTDVDRRRKQLSRSERPPRQAANAIKREGVLSKFSASMRQGDYKRAAENLEKLAQQLREQVLRMSAEDFESTTEDFQALAMELLDEQELSDDARECSAASSEMNRDRLSEAMRKFAKRLRENADRLSQCDSLCQASGALSELQNRIGRAGSRRGWASAFMRRESDKKGGLRAGVGTADTYSDGLLDAQGIGTTPDLVTPREGAGASTRITTTSRDERARSGQELMDQYVEMMQRAEADLDIESVPISYREFLRRYFVAIRSYSEEEGSP